MEFPESIAARLDRLERECRWWRWAFIATVLISGTVLLAGGAARDDVPKRIEAEAFVLKDSTGTIKAVLGSWPRSHATYLRFLDERGQRLDLGTQAGLAVIKLFGEERRQGIRLEVTPKGVGTVMVRESETDPSPSPHHPSKPSE